MYNVVIYYINKNKMSKKLLEIIDVSTVILDKVLERRKLWNSYLLETDRKESMKKLKLFSSYCLSNDVLSLKTKIK